MLPFCLSTVHLRVFESGFLRRCFYLQDALIKTYFVPATANANFILTVEVLGVDILLVVPP